MKQQFFRRLAAVLLITTLTMPGIHCGANIQQEQARKTAGSKGLSPFVVESRENVHLPDDYTFPMGEDSPGPVTFSHESHYNYDEPNCKDCHPAHFKMLEPGKSPEGPITMDSMAEGKNCGACHNGKIAFDAMDDENCTVCHQEE